MVNSSLTKWERLCNGKKPVSSTDGVGKIVHSFVFFLHVAVQFSQHHLLRRLFPTGFFFPALLKISWPYNCYFWIFYSWSHESIFVSVPYCFDYYSLKLGTIMPPALFCVKIILAILSLSWFHTNFKDSLF